MNSTHRDLVLRASSFGAIVALLAAPHPRALAAQALEDNSFLVEEAYNQPARVVQHVFTGALLHGSAGFSFTQEWPLGGQKHQLSYTLLAEENAGFAVGDGMVNYRWQALGGEEASLFVAPRFSVLVPLGGNDAGGAGVEGALPVSWAAGRRLTLHGNVGASWRPDAKEHLGDVGSTLDPFVGASAVVFLTPKLNLLAESVWRDSWAVAVGARAGFDLPNGMQIVPGAAWMPAIADAPTRSFLYLSIEHGF